MSKRQLQQDFQRIKNIMSRIIRLHGGQCIDNTHRGPGIHTTYRLGNVTVGYTWHLSPSDSRFALKKNIADLKRVLRRLGLEEQCNELVAMFRSSHAYELEQELFDIIRHLERVYSSTSQAA